eukprot:Awhi_evm1s9602
MNFPLKLHPSSGTSQNIHLGSCGLHMSSDIVVFCSWSVGKDGYTKLAEGEYSVLISERVGGNAGNLFTLIENDQGYIFGGFVVDKFEVPSRWVGGNPENFIFSFGKRDEVIFPPVKLHPSNGNCQNIHLGSCGLHMSSDIVAFCSWSVGKNGYTKLAEGEYSVLISETVGGNAGDFTPVRAE